MRELRLGELKRADWRCVLMGRRRAGAAHRAGVAIPDGDVPGGVGEEQSPLDTRGDFSFRLFLFVFFGTV